MNRIYDYVISAILVVSIVLISGCIGQQPTTSETGSQKKYNITANMTINATTEVTTACGEMDCFETKFKECKPATVTSKLTETIIYYYEIIGPKEGLCEVKSKFTANPNTAWVGKEMTCKYDNSKTFGTAIQDMSKCQGPLYTLMTGG